MSWCACLAAAALLPAAAPGEEPGPLVLPPGVRAWEPFELAEGESVLGHDGGLGWVGPWQPSRLAGQGPWPNVCPRRPDGLYGEKESLSLPGLTDRGGSAAAAARSPHCLAIQRLLAAPPVGVAGTTTYVGARLRAEGRPHAGNGYGFFGISVVPISHQSTLPGREIYGTRPNVGFGKSFGDPRWPPSPCLTDWCLHSSVPDYAPVRAAGRSVLAYNWGQFPRRLGGNSGTNAFLTTGRPVVPGATTLLVLKVEAAPRRDGRVLHSLFVNPNPAAEPPPAAMHTQAVPGNAVNHPTLLTIAASGAFGIDELRVAGTMAAAAGLDPARD